MQQDVARFARRILALHLALLVLLLVVVSVASREIYNSAHEQAVRQAENRQALLVAQTARGIDEFYQAVLSDLDLLGEAEAEQEEMKGLLPKLGPGVKGLRGMVLARLIARQLKDRSSQIFLIDKKEMRPIVIGGSDPDLPAAQVVATMGDWLLDVDKRSISPFTLFEVSNPAAGGAKQKVGVHLVAVPLGRQQRGLLVVVVPVRVIERLFLDKVNEQKAIGAYLIDEEMMTTMAGSRSHLVGSDLRQLNDPQVCAAMDRFAARHYRGTEILTKPYRLGPDLVGPTILTAEPIQVMPDRRWFLLVATGMEEVDALVKDLFRRTVLWSLFVVVCGTGILVSTAAQMIRVRARFERVRREVLERELDQAREIQIAWLPKQSPSRVIESASGGRALLDVAAVNKPASHISGDFYNWFDLPGGRIAIVIGDVTGHGMSAAFLMATTQLLVRNTLPRCDDPGQCLSEVNRQLCVQVFHGQFVTMQIIVIDPESGRLDAATAGHPRPLLSESNGEDDPEPEHAAHAPGGANGHRPRFRPLPLEPQLILGVEPDTEYPTESFPLSPHTTLLLYTDGLPDAQSPDGRRFDFDGLRRRLNGFNGDSRTARSLVDRVVGEVDAFRGPRDLGDDLTVVAVQFQSTEFRPAGEPAWAASV